tara:strand:+ start:149 stop:436 length:288 start_codon:yes stop_codon:yes gene_type:complete
MGTRNIHGGMYMKNDVVIVKDETGVTPVGHTIYFDAIERCGGFLALKCNDIKLAKAKATAWLNWTVCQSEPVNGYWEETDYLTYFWRVEPTDEQH